MTTETEPTAEQIRARRVDHDFTIMHTLVLSGQSVKAAARTAASRTTGASMLSAGYQEWVTNQLGPFGYAWLYDGDDGEDRDLWLLAGVDELTGQAVYQHHTDPSCLRRYLAIEDEYGVSERGPAVSLRLNPKQT